MIKVKFSHNFKNWPLERQLPNSFRTFGDCEFYINKNIKECDYWFIFDNVSEPDQTMCSRENIVLITAEPPDIKSYDDDFIKQFTSVITCHSNIYSENVIKSQQGQPWFVGYDLSSKKVEKNYNDLIKSNPAKEKLISVITSIKSVTDGHRKRYDFVMKLKEYFGDKIDIYGQGINNINDKWDAIAPYKYHIAIENTSIEDYWSEKIADSYLGGAYPLYYGCTNIDKYFSPESYSLIDINDFEKSVQIILNVIENNLYEKRVQNIYQAKDLILNKYNVFALINEYIQNQPVTNKNKSKLIIYPEYFPCEKRNEFEKFKHKPIKYILDKIGL